MNELRQIYIHKRPFEFMVWASQKNEEVYKQEMELQFLRATTLYFSEVYQFSRNEDVGYEEYSEAVAN